ncbi:MAG: SAP domain-containing protein [Deltaproteobacteria bacterium]|nr:SAP domain-containing protein [Deltaproteobacteria bacterium]
MKITEIREKAKKLEIKSGKMKKAELIRMIQKAEGNTVCFGQAQDNNCPYTDCCFREDCLV